MLYYVTLGTDDAARAHRFYGPTLATIGIVPLHVGTTECSYGTPGATDPILYVGQP